MNEKKQTTSSPDFELRLEAAERVVEAARALEAAVLYEAGAREKMHVPRAVLAASLDALDAAAPARAGDAERQKRLGSLVVALGQIARIGHAAVGLVEAREALDKCVAIARKARAGDDS